MRPQLEVGRSVAVEARVWSLEQGSLRWLEGDEDIAPQVFAMAMSEKVAGGACVAWAQMGVRWKGDLAWLLFST